MTHAGRIGTGAMALAVLAGCGTISKYPYSPEKVLPGQTEAQAIEVMGPPTGRYALEGGASELEYARGPLGKHTFMIDLDKDGRVTGWRQVLTEVEFNRIEPGMSSDEVLRRLGRPSDERGYGWMGGQIWSYRYDNFSFCLWFQASVINGRVKDSGYGPDPMCDAGKDKMK